MRDLRASDTADMKVVLRAGRMTSDLANMICELLVGLVRASSIGGWLMRATYAVVIVVGLKAGFKEEFSAKM